MRTQRTLRRSAGSAMKAARQQTRAVVRFQIASEQRFSREIARLRSDYEQLRMQELARVHEELEIARRIEVRRADQKYFKLLGDIAQVMDEYQVVLVEMESFHARIIGQQTIGESDSAGLLQLLTAPFNRLAELLSSHHLTAQHAVPGSALDLSAFEVAGTMTDVDQPPGTVVRAHRPAYLAADGKVIRKGAAIVTTHSEQ